MKYKLEIKPAIPPSVRHIIEKKLTEYGYHIHGSGTDTDLSVCDISFSDDKPEKMQET